MKNNKNLSLSVVIPCYNEENNLNRGVLNQVYHYLKKQSYPWQVIIANDGSTDNSLKITNDFVKNHPGFIALDLPHGGKPSALKGGLAKVKNDIVLFTDMDQSTPISELDKLLPYFSKGYQVVIGSRGTERHNFNLSRRLASAIFSSVRRLILLPNIIDTQCGFKAFTEEAASKIFPQLTIKRWGFDIEILVLARLMGFRIKEVGVRWINDPDSKVKASAYIEVLTELIKIRLNIWRKKYKIN